MISFNFQDSREILNRDYEFTVEFLVHSLFLYSRSNVTNNANN